VKLSAAYAGAATHMVAPNSAHFLLVMPFLLAALFISPAK
jgi:hypothetical protein